MPDRNQTDQSLWLVLPQPVRRFPADLAAVVAFVLATMLVVLVPYVNETPLRVVFGLVFVLFLPGYAFIAALFPEAGSSPTAVASEVEETDAAEETQDVDDVKEAAESPSATDGGFANLGDRGIDGIERVALSFGLSIAIVPLIGLVLNFTPWGIRLVPILLSVSGFTLAATGIAAIRRWNLPADERFRVPYQQWLSRARGEIFNPETRLDGVLNVLLAASILLAVGAVGYAIVVPPQGEQFTEFYILSEDENDNLVAANYPTEFELGDSQPIIVGIANQEHEALDYTVVVQLQEVEITANETTAANNETAVANNETTVIDRVELDRFTTALDHNETLHREVDIEPTRVGEDLRVQFLLYRDDPPDEPTLENSYRDVHLWIDVFEDEP